MTITPQLWHGNCDLSILAFRLPKSSLVKNLAGSLRILLDIYGQPRSQAQERTLGMRLIYGTERGTQYRNNTFRKPWSGHRITYSSSSTCCGLGILYPSWSKLTIFLPSIRGYGEPPKKEKVTSFYNTLLHDMSSLKICCCRCCCFYSKRKELTVSGCKDNLFTHSPLYLPHFRTRGTTKGHQFKSWCKYLVW